MMYQVRAIETGYYGSKRRDPGEEFAIDDVKAFSKKWMEPIGWKPNPLDHDGDGSSGGAATPNPPVEGLRALTVAKLRDRAAAGNIDLGDAKSKADIIAAIELAEESKPSVLTDDEKIAKAKELSGRDDIADVAEAETIIAAADDTI